MVVLTVMALVGVSFSMVMYYNEHIMRLKVYWKSNLLPSWTQMVLTSFVFFKKYLFIYLFIWLHRVLVMAGGLLSCSMWAP